MIKKGLNLRYCFVLTFIKLIGAQEVPNTSSNQGSSKTSLQPRFFDHGAMGIPNFGSERFGNPTSNYPTNSFMPYGNQDVNMQWPQGFGLSYPTQGNFPNIPPGYPNQQGYPNLQGYPYQGDNMSPIPNYQRPQYPNQNIQNRPVQGGFPNQDASQYQGNGNTRYPNYQWPSYPTSPDYGSTMYPDDMGRRYQNGGMPTSQDEPGKSFQYPVQDNQYPSQGNFQGNGYTNDMNFNFRPDDVGNFHNTYLPYGLKNQYDKSVQRQLGHFPNNPSNYNSYTNEQFPTNYPGGTNGDPSAIQYPNQRLPNTVGLGNGLPTPSFNAGLNNAFYNQHQVPNNQGNIPINNDNETAAILGKPVIVPPTTTLPGQAVLDNSTTDAATQKKCVQDCSTTSEYDPVCGTDNVTYINAGKFSCAQECGIAVHLQQRGRCPGDIIPNTLKQL